MLGEERDARRVLLARQDGRDRIARRPDLGDRRPINLAALLWTARLRQGAQLALDGGRKPVPGRPTHVHR
jgi:hypothetical protein